MRRRQNLSWSDNINFLYKLINKSVFIDILFDLWIERITSNLNISEFPLTLCDVAFGFLYVNLEIH